ncbi:putative 40S ribosomal protein S5, mitochondrial [Termitomyces sp. J132]|nr:putative 40S ribosomal protein S5, mitochondrial [Termitomyces sp. J132]
MHRALRLRSVARLGRVQRHIPTHSSPSLLLRRHYASKKTPAEKFDRILASLRPHMKTDEIARKMAALLELSADNEELAERMIAALRPLVHAQGVNQELLSAKVDLYMAEMNRQRITTMPENDKRYTQLSTDPSLEFPGLTLENHLQNEEVQKKLGEVHFLRRADMIEPLKRIEEDATNMEAYIEVAKLLEEFGVPVTYQRRTLPGDSLDELPGLIDEARQLINSNEQEIAAEDPVMAADMAVEDPEQMWRAEVPWKKSKSNNLSETSESGMPESEAEAEGEESDADIKAEEEQQTGTFTYPDLMVSDPLLDSRDVLELPPDGKEQIFHNRVIVRNHTSIFHEAMEAQGFDFDDPEFSPTRSDETEESASSHENLPLSPTELKDFYRFILHRRRVSQQTGKGKIQRMYILMVVGNGNGMVGLGQAKDVDVVRAEFKAYAQAVRNMDWVERFENRTIWTDMETKLGSTQLLLRPRPVGFGLRCNPNLHQVLRAAGIKDISAKVWGSRNPINVVKAAFRMLQAGHAPLGMGDGIGGRGRKLDKGSGLRSKEDVERERGRQLISLRK